MQDIETEDDIKDLVDSFYDEVRKDELLAPIFDDVIGDKWDEHLPVMYGFWTTLLIRHEAFTGQPYPKHAVLPLTVAHFEHWLLHFKQTIDTKFEGKTADEAKRLASQIAMAFMYKMKVA